MAKWFYYNESGEKIEVTGGQLKGLAKAGMITPDTVIETEEGKSAPARKVKGLTFPEPESHESDNGADEVESLPAKIGWMSSLNVLKTAARQENPEAMFYLGYWSLYVSLQHVEIKQDEQMAAQCFTRGAKFAAQGSAAGLCCAGLCAEYGFGVTKDDLTAVKYYEDAAKKGFAFAYLCLAHAYSEGGEFIEKDEKEAAVYSATAFKQLMQECIDEREAIELVVLQCNHAITSFDYGAFDNIESSKCPKEFRKAFEACLEHIIDFLKVVNEIVALNQQYAVALDNINSGTGDGVVDGIADAVGGRRWMFDLKGGAADAGISLVTNLISGAIKHNQAKEALDASYQNELYKLDSVRREVEERVKESVNRAKKIAARYDVKFYSLDTVTVLLMTPVQCLMEHTSPGQTAIANSPGTDGQKPGCLVMLGFLGLLATGCGVGCLMLLVTLLL